MKDTDNKTKKNILEDSQYIEYIYSNKRRPKTDYPEKLATHLRDIWYTNTGTLLDIGCGRGDMLKALHDVGFNVSGVDISPASADACKPHPVKIVNLESNSIPFQDQEFDFIFSKSVIEHLHNPMPFLTETHRVLGNNGKAIIMTPSWLHHGWGPFYLDYTHVTPFTLQSLRDAMNIAGFKNVKVVYFYQLPITWKFKWSIHMIRFLSIFPLRYYPMYDIKLPNKINTLFRFTKEVMLLGIGEK